MSARFPFMQWFLLLGVGGVLGWFSREVVVERFPLRPSVAVVEVKEPEQIEPTPKQPPVPAESAVAKAPAAPERELPKPPSDFGEVSDERLATMDLKFALEEGAVLCEFRGNYRDRLKMVVSNQSGAPLRLSLPLGQGFEGSGGRVLLARPRVIDLHAGETRLEELATVALSARNPAEEGMFVPAKVPLDSPQEALLLYAEEHPEIPLPAIQTAFLALVENLPLSVFAKFETATPRPSGIGDTFKAETVDLVQALAMLRAIGVTEPLALTQDPQMKIEAMIDPMAHAAAMAYYGIAPEEEWAYWKLELLNGNPSTRHYALYGIGRYFPDVALTMLPVWAREVRTSRIYRMTALQALAATQRKEALDLLRALQGELGEDAELGKIAAESARYLEVTLSEPEQSRLRIGYRLPTVSHQEDVEFVETPQDEPQTVAGEGIAAPPSDRVNLVELFNLEWLRLAPSQGEPPNGRAVSVLQSLPPEAL